MYVNLFDAIALGSNEYLLCLFFNTVNINIFCRNIFVKKLSVGRIFRLDKEEPDLLSCNTLYPTFILLNKRNGRVCSYSVRILPKLHNKRKRYNY